MPMTDDDAPVPIDTGRLRRLLGAPDLEWLVDRVAERGLDLGGRTPEETALPLAAEIVAARHGGVGLPLRSTHAHADPPIGRHGFPR